MKKINIDTWNRKSNYEYFSTFPNPCYGLDVEMDITKLYNITKKRADSFFINFLYAVTMGLNDIEELRTRIIDNEVIVYDTINPSYTVMTNAGCYDNCGHNMTIDYHKFYMLAKEEIEKAKTEEKIKDCYNSNESFDVFYMTCVPWLKYNTMTHPLPNNNPTSSSVPRVCWGKYYFENNKVKILLNITVSHTVCDGYPLSKAFLKVQEIFDNIEEYIN